MIYVFNGTKITYREPIHGTWAGGETSILYTDAKERQQGFGRSAVSFGTATIIRNAAFSHFPGITRIHMPLTGNGLHLHFQQPDEDVVLHTFNQYRFDGGRPLQTELIETPISAFNLMTQPNRAGKLRIWRSGDRFAASESIQAHHVQAFYVVSGSLTVSLPNQPAIILDAADTLVLEAGATQPIRQQASADAVVVVVEVQ